MTAAAQASRRPTKPPRSKAIYAGLIAFVVITLISVSEEWGIGLDIGDIVEDLGNGRVILEQLLAPNWAFLPRVVDPLIETFQIAVVAAFIGCGLALPISFFASRAAAPRRPSAMAMDDWMRGSSILVSKRISKRSSPSWKPAASPRPQIAWASPSPP